MQVNCFDTLQNYLCSVVPKQNFDRSKTDKPCIWARLHLVNKTTTSKRSALWHLIQHNMVQFRNIRQQAWTLKQLKQRILPYECSPSILPSSTKRSFKWSRLSFSLSALWTFLGAAFLHFLPVIGLHKVKKVLHLQQQSNRSTTLISISFPISHDETEESNCQQIEIRWNWL
jgi:hypothetical protein